MARVTAHLVAAALLAVLATGCGGGGTPSGPRTPAPASGDVGDVSLSIDDMPQRAVSARVREGRLVAEAVVHGRAQPFSTLRVSSPCRQDGCLTSADVDGHGRWHTAVRVSATPAKPFAQVTAELAGQSAISLVRLRDPTAPARARAAARRSARRRARARAVERRALQAEARQAQAFGDGDADTPSELGSGAADPPDIRLPHVKGSGGVLVVGDSLEVLTGPYIKGYLPGYDVTLNAKGGYNSLQIFGLFQDAFEPSQSVVVFDAGTNDNPNYPQILAGRLQALEKVVGDRCLVVPTIHGLKVDGTGDAGKNRVVRAFAASRPGTQTPEWAAFEAAHPELMQPDDLHPTAKGAQYRAQLIAQGVLGCMQELAN